MRRKTWRHTNHVDRDIEMQIPVLPQLPESVYVRSGPSRVAKMGRIDVARCREQRVQFRDVPLTPVRQGQRGVTPAGFF